MSISSRRPSERWRDFAPGMRVVVRRRRDDNPGPYDPKLTDIIGHVVQITEDNVTLTVNAQEVTIPTSDIVAARHIQARPPSPRT